MGVARFISVVFHPLLLTTYLVVFFGQWVPGILLVRHEQLWLFYVFIFGITFVFPALTLLMFRRLELVRSLKMEERRERIWPFIINTLLYLVVVVLLSYKSNNSGYFVSVMKIVAALAVIATFCTFFFKISVHSLAWAGFLGIIYPLNQAVEGGLLYQILAIILILGMVMSSRLKLHAHTFGEVLSGAGIGLVAALSGMYWLF